MLSPTMSEAKWEGNRRLHILCSAFRYEVGYGALALIVTYVLEEHSKFLRSMASVLEAAQKPEHFKSRRNSVDI
jgi:hypothetical protein